MSFGIVKLDTLRRCNLWKSGSKVEANRRLRSRLRKGLIDNNLVCSIQRNPIWNQWEGTFDLARNRSDYFRETPLSDD